MMRNRTMITTMMMTSGGGGHLLRIIGIFLFLVSTMTTTTTMVHNVRDGNNDSNNNNHLLLFADAFILHQQRPPTSSLSVSTRQRLLLWPSNKNSALFHHHPSSQQQQRPIISSNSWIQRRSSSSRSTRLTILSSTTPDKDWEELDDDEDEEFVVSKEPFMSEADIADAANLLSSTSQSQSQQSQVIELQKEVENSFLQYSLSIILGRALPDGRDGLKPVHRRILYSMYQLNLVPNLPHRKCARVVGEVLGKYHPHGDMAVYDALVRMAQDFSTSYRLVDGHGNFGSIDADPAAAMRYTECRLTTLATSTLLQDIVYDNTVDFVPNFDGNEVEPSVLPSKLPLLLLNGSSGIAVGMATNIPPHNLREILTACRALVQDRMNNNNNDDDDTKSPTTITDDDLCRMVPGPDFPTGASIMGTSNSERLYKTGNGGIVMRATTHVEQLVRTTTKTSTTTSSTTTNTKKSNERKNNVVSSTGGGKTAIIVTELPYQVNKAALLEQIATLVNDKKLDGISDLRDESDRDGIRVVLELKRDAIPSVVLNNLYKKTKLQTVFSGNFVALMERKQQNGGGGNNNGGTGPLIPQRFTLRESLDYFLDFRFTTIRRKSSYQLQKVESRIHILEGLLLALERVDEVIELIRSLPDQQSCREALMRDPITDGGLIGLSRDQAESVLRLQLGQLTRLNQGKLNEERTDLESKSTNLQRLLRHDDAVYEVMIDEFNEMDMKFGDDRKTKILNDDGEVNEIDLVTNSRSVIVVTRGGYIKRMPLKDFESQRRGTRGKRGTSDTSSDDEVLHCITCNDHDTLLMISQDGLAYGLHAYQVPSGSRIARGTPLPSVLPIGIGRVITSLLAVSEFPKDEFLVLATKNGWIKKTPLDAFEKISSRGLTIASLDDGDKLQWCHRCTDDDDILVGSTRGIAVRFEAASLRPTGRTSRGIRTMKLRDQDTIADMNVVDGQTSTDNGGAAKSFVLCVTEQGYGKRVPTSEFRTTSRRGSGVIATKFKKGLNDRMSSFCIVQEEDEVLVITSKGIMVRQKVRAIPCQSRTATGAVLQKVDPSDYIASVSLVPTSPDDERGDGADIADEVEVATVEQ